MSTTEGREMFRSTRDRAARDLDPARPVDRGRLWQQARNGDTAARDALRRHHGTDTATADEPTAG